MSTDRYYRIEACSHAKNLDWFTVHGFQGASKRMKVIDTARSMREHMDDDFIVRIIEKEDGEETVIWKE